MRIFKKKTNSCDLTIKANKVKYDPISKKEQWQKYFFEKGKQERDKNSNAKILVLGLGGGGSRVINDLFQKSLRNVIFGVINEYNFEFIDPNLSIQYELYYDGKEEGHAVPFYVSKQSSFDLLYDNEINKNWVKGLLYESLGKVILVLGFGGHFASLIVNWICKIINEFKIPLQIIGTLPFLFEGEKREKAFWQIKSIEDIGGNVIIIDSENLYNNYTDINFYNCFSYLDKEISKKILDIIDKY